LEVIIFPKDYEKYREQLVEDNKIFIRGKVSLSEEDQAKLIAEKIISFDDVPKELWIRFDDITKYKSQESDLLQLMDLHKGKDTLIVYLEKEKQKKVFSGNHLVDATQMMGTDILKKYGDKSVKIVDKAVHF
jgi:DNA polymerase-3 subunit alpha